MKKLLGLLILLALIPVATIVPDRAHDAKRTYEQRLVASLGAVKDSVRSLPGGEAMNFGLYAPNVEPRAQGNGLVVTGILMSWPPIVGSDRNQMFTAVLHNACQRELAADCLRVNRLDVGETRLVDGGTLVDFLPGRSDILNGDPKESSELANIPPHPGSVDRETGDITQPRDGSPPTPASAADAAPDDLIAQIQRALRNLGYDPGPSDNVAGPKTVSAILAYQRSHGLETDGNPSVELLKHILERETP